MVEGNSRARLRSANNNGSLPIGRRKQTNETVAGFFGGQVAGRAHYKKAAPKKKRRTEARRW